MKNILTISILVVGLYLTNCTPKAIVSKNNQGSSINDDDLATYRTKYEYKRESFEGKSKIEEIILPFDSASQRYDMTLALNKSLDYVYKPAYKTDFERKKYEGYRVQIYRGRSREEASKARQRSYELFPNLTPYFIYSAPTYRVRVGDFLEAYEYQPVLKRFKKEFPDAISVPDIVNIVIDNRNYRNDD